MSTQMSSGAPAPILVPVPGVPPAAPKLVPPRPKPSGTKRLGWIIFLVIAAIGIERGIHFANRPATPSGAGASVIRTATVAQGGIARTIRLTGTTGAEKFSSLISPQLRGNRSGGGRDGSFRQGGGGGGGSMVLQSNSRGGGGSGNQSSASSSSSTGGTDSSGSSSSASTSVTST